MAYGKQIKLWRTPDEHGDFPPLTPDKIERLKSKALNYCMWSLGNTPKTRAQLTEKMVTKNCPPDIIEETLTRLEQMYLLDDNEFAESYVRSKQTMRKGKRKIAQDLKQKGIDAAIIEQVLSDTTDEDETERAREVILKKLKSTQRLERHKRVNRLVSGLVRNGYNMGIAFSVVNECLDAEILPEIDEDEEDNE